MRLLAIFWATMSVAGLAVEYLFRAVGIPDPARPTMVVHTGFEWNYTTVLNIVALLGFAVVYWLYRRRDTGATSRFAKDPVCGMQVEIAYAPASAHRRRHDVLVLLRPLRAPLRRRPTPQLSNRIGTPRQP